MLHEHQWNYKNRQRLICRINKPCGFGCSMHHLARCLGLAVATRRRLLLDDSGWMYAARWLDVFQPVHEPPSLADWWMMLASRYGFVQQWESENVTYDSYRYLSL